MDSATIAAISTPPGEGGIGMVRMSGPEAAWIAEQIFRRPNPQKPLALKKSRSHSLVYGKIVDPITYDVIDEALLAWMAAPNTYTREDTVEFTCHGGPIPLQETLRVVLAAGARHAEPGEFTLRAFLNGRLDLSQAEAVLNVVSARTTEGLRLAIADLGGDLAKRLRPARDAVVSLLAYLDAAADFPEDEIPSTDIDADLRTADSALSDVVAGSQAGIVYREGAQIALVGKPNVGKSSLLNALLRSERAIVTPISGTTRDVIAESINLRGIPATLLDTAGIAETEDLVELLGIERSQRALSTALVAVLVLDGSRLPDADDEAVANLLARRIDPGGTGEVPIVVVVNKDDLPDRAAQDSILELLPDCPVIRVSSLTGDGISELEGKLASLLRGDAATQARPALITTRQRAALDRALSHIREARSARQFGHPIDLLATDVRAALHAIGAVTGEEVDEAVLTEIFSRFCIGK